MKKKIIIISIVLCLVGASGVFALNGYFGGGNAIPEDTMTRGLVGYWNFDEGSGAIAYDASDNSNDGTLENGVKWTEGKQGGSLQFDGSNDYVDCGSMSFTSDISVEAWIKTSVGWAGIVASGNVTNRCNLYIHHTGVIQFSNFGTGAGNGVITTNTYKDGNWYHIIGTREGSTWKVYVDGVKVDTGDASISIGVGSKTVIGCVYSAYRHFNGSIDDVRIYNRALEAEEVRYHYNRGGPVAHWKFDEGTGTTAYDSTDNNNDGTLTNMDDSDWVQGRYGTALDLDGTDDVISATQTSAINLTSKKGYTISSWVYPHSDGEADAGEIIDKGADTFLRVDNEADSLLDVEAKLDLTTTDATLNITDAISINVWSHIVLAYEDDDDDEITIYVNGINKGTSTDGDGAPATDSNNLLIGGDSAANFDGLIDDVRIYAYARSADEIRLDYNAGFAAKFGPAGKSCSKDPASCMDYGLAASYNMDEGAGDILYDQSDSGNDGTLGSGAGADGSDPKWINRSQASNSPGSLTSDSSGSALQFDGTDDYINCGNDSSLNITDAITIEAWVKPKTAPSAGNVRIVNKGEAATEVWVLLYDALGNIYFYLYDGGVARSVSSSISINQWQHITGTYDGSNFYIYVNGIELDTLSYSGDIDISNGVVSFGARPISEDKNFNGSIDGVKIYNRALSAEEVRYHYNKGKPVAHWSFDEGSGTTAHDVIGDADAQFPSNEANQPTWSRP